MRAGEKLVAAAAAALLVQGCAPGAPTRCGEPQAAASLNPTDALGNVIYRVGEGCAIGVAVPPYSPCEPALTRVPCPEALDDPAWHACQWGAIELADGACVCRRSNGSVDAVDCPAQAAPGRRAPEGRAR